jgi:hypothetical protein
MRTQSKNEVYEFDEQHIVVAYKYDNTIEEERVCGVFITYPGEEFTKRELMDYFFLVEPSHLVAVELDYDESLNMDNCMDKLEELIDKLYVSDFSGLIVNHYIPATIH